VDHRRPRRGVAAIARTDRLKPGRSVGEIRPALRLIQLTSALVLVIFAIVFMVA
jgi:hypothetical protein